MFVCLFVLKARGRLSIIITSNWIFIQIERISHLIE
eukprot:UN07416